MWCVESREIHYIMCMLLETWK